MHWWEDGPHILGGRDSRAGGTWLGITQSGRFSFLTNVREVQSPATCKAHLPQLYVEQLTVQDPHHRLGPFLLSHLFGLPPAFPLPHLLPAPAHISFLILSISLPHLRPQRRQDDYGQTPRGKKVSGMKQSWKAREYLLVFDDRPDSALRCISCVK